MHDESTSFKSLDIFYGEDHVMFHDIIITVASAIGTSSVSIFFLKQWLSSGIQHQYNQKIEAYKTQLQTQHDLAILDIKTTLAKESTLHSAAHAAFAEGQKAAMERKLTAIDKLWGAVVQLRGAMPPVLRLMDVMTLDDYKKVKDEPKFRSFMAADLRSEKIMSLTTQEEVRPYVGEYMWAVFVCYQTILVRIVSLLYLGRTDSERFEWHKDSGTRNILGAVLDPTELKMFDDTLFGKISWLQERLDSKFLSGAQRIISGANFGMESLEQTKMILKQVNQLAVAESPQRLIDRR